MVAGWRNEPNWGNTRALGRRSQVTRDSTAKSGPRCSAAKSTGPVTEEGKRSSRCNAVRHGLTAETVIGALEDAQDYQAFKAAIVGDYDAQSAVERELVLRLASLLWRLRRATATESWTASVKAARGKTDKAAEKKS
jgi:hypothetical protein